MLDLVDRIYCAAEDQALWPSLLKSLAGTLGCPSTNLFVQDLRHPGGNAFATFGTDPSFTRSYADHYGKINVFLIRGRALLKSGNVAFSNELCPDGEAFRSEFYNDWVRPQGQSHGLLGTVFNQHFLVGNVGAIRARGAKPFTPEDKRLVEALLPHLQRAVRLRSRIAELETLGQSTSDALNHWATAVFLVNRDAHILLANDAAVETLAGRDGLFSEHGVLRTTHSCDTAILHQSIRHAIDRVIVHADHAIGAMLLARISGKRPFHVYVSPAVRKDLFLGVPGSALVFVSNPEAHQTQSDVLQKLYALTVAEAAVAALLADGKSVREIAEATSVRENTIRIHLKRIFDKTGTKRQAELVNLVLSGAAALRTRR
jgi:DNA-binding CsgD family transcriptional regulator